LKFIFRGTLDGCAYMEEQGWWAMLENLGLSETSLRE